MIVYYRATISIAYKLKNLEEKLARYRNHLTFLIKCRNNNVIPKGLRLTSSVESEKVGRILHRAGKAILRERIKTARMIKTSLNEQRQPTINRIRDLPNLSYHEKELILQWAEQHGIRTFYKTKYRHIRKFQQLITNQCQLQKEKDHLHSTARADLLHRDRLVINLSKIKLTEHQRGVLELGLNLAPTPKDIPRYDIIARTEDLARKLTCEKRRTNPP